LAKPQKPGPCDIAEIVKLIEEWDSKMSDGIPSEILDIIERRCAAATPGPWKFVAESRIHDTGDNFIKTERENIYLSGATVADHDFIASARQDIPRLLAEVRSLRQIVGLQT
jgi:hypothetical protein